MNERENLDGEANTSEQALSVRSISVCALMLVFYALYFARSMFVPNFTASFAYLTLRPIVRQTRRLGVPSTSGPALVMLFLAAVVALGTYLVFEPARSLIADAPANMALVKQRSSFAFEKLEDFNKATEEITDRVEESPTSAADEPVPVEVKQPAWHSNLSIVNGTGNLLSFLVVAGVLLCFLLASGDDLLRGIMRAMPSLTARKQLVSAVHRVQEGLGSYLAQVTAINVCLGVAVERFHGEPGSHRSVPIELQCRFEQRDFGDLISLRYRVNSGLFAGLT